MFPDFGIRLFYLVTSEKLLQSCSIHSDLVAVLLMLDYSFSVIVVYIAMDFLFWFYV